MICKFGEVTAAISGNSLLLVRVQGESTAEVITDQGVLTDRTNRMSCVHLSQ